MKKPCVFAVHITSLTDARYFAAMGVDFIGFELASGHTDQVDLDFVQQVREWLEGPAIVGCVDGNESLNTLTKWVVEGGLDGLYFKKMPDNAVLKSFGSLDIFLDWEPGLIVPSFMEAIKLIVPLPQLEQRLKSGDTLLSQQMKKGDVFVSGDFDSAFFHSEIFEMNPGLVLSGSEEEKTGFKSFDELDEVFEFIQG